ncbi:MAG: tetratricopeptide repeat protein [Firmicutes bacterium]|nr:tetratricopeptide repeat protein [Bacillota bacterium]
MTEQKAAELRHTVTRLTEIGELEEAKEAIQKLIELEGHSSFAYNKLGVIFARSEDLGRAKTCFENALTIEPESAPALSNLGNVYRENGDLDGAIRLYKSAIEYDPDYATAYHNLGVVYRQKGDFQKAVEHLKQGNKLQRVMARRELKGTSLGKRQPVFWVVLALAAAAFLYLFRR